MFLFRMFYRIAAVTGIAFIMVKIFNVPFSLWWFIPMAVAVWMVTEIRALYVKKKIETKRESDEQNDGPDEQVPFVDLEKEADGSWKARERR